MEYALDTPLYNAQAVQAMDASAIAAGTDGYALMRRAAHSAFQTLRRLWPRAKHIVVLCGPGNNGGDGYVLAELAHRSGRVVTLLQIAKPNSSSAQHAYNDATAAGLEVHPFHGKLPNQTELIVDALFGVGLTRAPQGLALQAITMANAHPAPCFAIDIPSGLSADTGHVLVQAIVAQATCSFIAPKLGLFTGEGPACSGQLFFDSLGVEALHIRRQRAFAYRLNANAVEQLLPSRTASAHKGSAGHVLIIGGNQGMSGAVRLAGEAALRTGAGLVSIVCHPACVLAVGTGRPELMVHGIDDAQQLHSLLEKADAVVIGPGLGKDAWAATLLGKVINHPVAKVLDADALNLLSAQPQKQSNAVLTPHPAEAARLLGISTSRVQSDRPKAAQELAKRTGGTAVLKGPGTLIASMGQPLYLCDRGNPGMASGGMGDLLTGVIAALLAEGCSLHSAAAAGTWLHSTAADIAATDGQTGLVASDLLPALRQLRDNPHKQIS